MKLIISNGMQRSGSTWLYNATRYVLMQFVPEDDFAYGWIDDVKNRKKVTLIKSHFAHTDALNQADLLLYSYRDIRDVLASLHRMWGISPTPEHADRLINDFLTVSPRADYLMKYEEMVQNPLKTIKELIDLVKTRLPCITDKISCDADGVLSRLKAMTCPTSSNRPYDSETLLHPNHITSHEPMSFTKLLPENIVRLIETRHRHWFLAHHYKLTSAPNDK